MPSTDFLSQDPTTWSDFTDPAAHGFTKVDCDTSLETGLRGVAVVLAFAAGMWLLIAMGPSRGDRSLPRAVADPIVPVLLLIVAALLVVLKLLTDNFYLIDPGRHVIYYHFRFVFFRRVRLLLERKDIAAVTVESRHRRSRYSSWWEYRVVLVNANGHVLPLSNWRREDLWSCNNEASDLAKKLECETHEAPEESRLVISVQNGRTTATFAPFPWWSRGGNYYLLALMLLVYVGLALVRLGRH